MKIDDNLISYLQELSKLKLSKTEQEKAKNDLSEILDHIDKLDELIVNDSELSSHHLPFTNNFREDVAINSEVRDNILANAPEKKDNYFKVPTTVE